MACFLHQKPVGEKGRKIFAAIRVRTLSAVAQSAAAVERQEKEAGDSFVQFLYIRI